MQPTNPAATLALHGGPKTVTRTFPWSIYDEAETEAVARIVQSGKWGNPDCGDEIERFEQAFASYCGSKYAITCVNGSVSLRLALMACGVKPGDEVIVPPYTFITTATSVIECNCVPVFVDIDPDTYNISPAAIEAAITPHTKVIIPVHFGGLACDMDAIMDIATRHGLKVIEDAAHAHGAEYKGKKLGSIGHAGSFSFQSSKNLTSGEGGIVITDDDDLYAMIHSLRNVGRVEGGQWYDHYNPGCNYRITQMQAVLLSEQLKRLDAQTRKRNENGLYLNQLLAEVNGITPLSRSGDITLHCYHIYIFKYDAAHFGGLSKTEFADMLAAEGVPSFRGYPHPLYKQPLFQNKNFMCYAIPETADYSQTLCPVAEQACATDAVWILQHAMLGEKEDMEAFVRAILKIQEAVNA
ncbi:DegT/DnrJ/EryC1/StrS family aminotransferase [Dyadobacter sandarakinus]|uniref:DegT/DnrJ/EryC1/StrS family aminotransferase n=1 Tax=Dyadobacter sandarakinus TaxID=2747268 RepID=A0ABX7I7S3_9BACT|nr:DegT/DnrJ/EryC1/StrS family aminotransferase [Dyadobacter sandarakinus]QRR02146.1 DegT/DnrJ/EryC1/StrS family aminotransferase [Dyadobacter sandarakinus]